MIVGRVLGVLGMSVGTALLFLAMKRRQLIPRVPWRVSKLFSLEPQWAFHPTRLIIEAILLFVGGVALLLWM